MDIADNRVYEFLNYWVFIESTFCWILVTGLQFFVRSYEKNFFCDHSHCKHVVIGAGSRKMKNICFTVCVCVTWNYLCMYVCLLYVDDGSLYLQSLMR